MKLGLEKDDEQFLTSLERLGQGTVQDLCNQAGVTATAVRQRLGRLQSLGLVERRAVRSGRGRPHHAYQLTDLGHRQLGDNYTELAQLLWNELHSIDEVEVRQKVAGRVRDALVNLYGSRVDGKSLSDRFSQLKSVLVSRGFSVEVDSRESLPILRENHCPYHELAQLDSGICELEQQVFERVLGVPLAMSSCCRDGQNCCEFHPA